MLPAATLRAIAKKYGYDAPEIDPPQSGYRNTSFRFRTARGDDLNFILYKREPDIVRLIRRTNALGGYVYERGLPVRAPVDKRILRVGQRHGSLYRYLDGETIPWEAYTMKHIKLLGMAMARFHDAARQFGGEMPDVEDVYAAIVLRMNAYFGDPNVTRALRDKLGMAVDAPDFTALLDQARRLPGRTVLHMDMVRSNVLFREAKAGDGFTVGNITLSGILDLEKAARGHVLFDVARSLAFLLVDCARPGASVRRYFLESGYRKRGGQNLQPVRLPSGDMLESLITLFLTYDFYKFLRQNPYESLPENHHFIRTAAVLRAQKVVQ